MSEEKLYPLGYQIPRCAPEPAFVPEENIFHVEKRKAKITSEEILSGALNYAIRYLLKKGERFDEVVQSFSGDKVKCIQYLRARSGY